MIRPLRILHVSPTFYPAIAYGGPIYSTKAITDGIARRTGFTIKVLTTDSKDPNSKARLKLSSNPIEMPAGYDVYYCRSQPGTSISGELLRCLQAEVPHADVVHLTGPYNFPAIPTLIACKRAGRPLVWSPRGGFQATAQWAATPKRRFKVAFEKLCARLGPRHMVLHVTAPMEAETSAQNFPDVKCALIPNAIDIPETLPNRRWRPKGQLRLAFLSRVHPKKGLDILLPALAELPDTVTLDIFGDGAPDYLHRLREEIARLRLMGRVRFRGLVSGQDKTRAFTECDLFVLPTHSENFGIVVAEALAHGTPVVTTMNAPWEGIETHGCGRWIPPTKAELVKAIRGLAEADLENIGQRGRDWMKAEFSSEGMVTRFEELYRDMAARAPLYKKDRP